MSAHQFECKALLDHVVVVTNTAGRVCIQKTAEMPSEEKHWANTEERVWTTAWVHKKKYSFHYSLSMNIEKRWVMIESLKWSPFHPFTCLQSNHKACHAPGLHYNGIIVHGGLASQQSIAKKWQTCVQGRDFGRKKRKERGKFIIASLLMNAGIRIADVERTRS